MPEHFTRGGLLLQGLAQFRIDLQLVEQSHVFDRNHGLVSEGFEKSDLLVGKRAALPSGESQSHQWGRLRGATGS